MLTRSRKRAQDQQAVRDREALPFIPIDVLAVSFSFLSLHDQCLASRVSRDWRRAALIAFAFRKGLYFDNFVQDVTSFFLADRLPSLRMLIITHIDSLSTAHQIASCFPHLLSLQILSFQNASMGDASFSVLAASLPSLSSSLKSLFLQNNKLNDEGARALSVILPRFLLLEDLTLSGNHFTDNGLILLSQAISQLKHFRWLILLQTTPPRGFFSSKATSALATALSSPSVARSLESLDLAQFESGKLIVAVLPLLQRLRSFALFGSDLNLDDLQAVADVCLARKCMFSLGVDLSNLGDNAVRVLLPAVSENQSSLTKLGLLRGGMTGAGLQLLGSCLSADGFSNLRSLMLHRSNFSTYLVSFASGVFKHLPSLEILSLSWDHVGDSDTAAIVSALHHLQHLQVLALSDNEISDVGLMSFLQLGLSLPPPPASLKVIDLVRNTGQPLMHPLTRAEKKRCSFIRF